MEIKIIYDYLYYFNKTDAGTSHLQEQSPPLFSFSLVDPQKNLRVGSELHEEVN